MHVKAGILALHGALPMMFIEFAGELVPRIRWHQAENEPQLQYTRGNWQQNQGSVLISYTHITWEEIPDEVMDKLSMEMIEIFLKTAP